MRKRRSLCSSVAALGVASLGVSPALGVGYGWTANGDGTSWNDPGNWFSSITCGSSPCFPKTPNDDATIAGNCSNCTIDLVDKEIDDLAISGVTVTFDGDDSETTLVLDTLTAGDTEDDTTITLTSEAILTNVSP